ncbi:hypothetical protein LMB49_02010 [Limosilactobacillus reuteri]|uniref:hypothetical protein n=1 Tax=Limosilactobacillus reuteri TaxID=1598 RepID=UPI001E5919A6|nr:hypothetical protein [Limosilactobacillus reuteri]MCC4370173.1 hypothetical protein [Limosilactobacillus reuteri]
MEKLTWKNIQEHGIELWEAKKNEFIKAVTKDSDFSWILDGDKKLLYEKVKEKGKQSITVRLALATLDLLY